MSAILVPFKRKASAVAVAVVLWASRQQAYVPVRPNPSQSVLINPSQGRIKKASKINGRGGNPSQRPKKVPRALAPVRTHTRAYAQARGFTPTFLGHWDGLGRIRGQGQ